ncbi:MAG: helix-turn-helix domain-containing protein [Pyrinomonadaceae bacterium]
MSERLLTTEEVGGRLGVTATRVRAMIAAGRLPAQKFGPVYLVLESDLAIVKDRKTGRPPKAQAANGTEAVAPAETTAKRKYAFREANEKRATKKAGKK